MKKPRCAGFSSFLFLMLWPAGGDEVVGQGDQEAGGEAGGVHPVCHAADEVDEPRQHEDDAGVEQPRFDDGTVGGNLVAAQPDVADECEADAGEAAEVAAVEVAAGGVADDGGKEEEQDEAQRAFARFDQAAEGQPPQGVEQEVGDERIEGFEMQKGGGDGAPPLAGSDVVRGPAQPVGQVVGADPGGKGHDKAQDEYRPCDPAGLHQHWGMFFGVVASVHVYRPYSCSCLVSAIY